MTSPPDFYDARQLEKIAVNLFYGWGYNFYRTENQLRADDLLVRSKVSWLLGIARASIESAESRYRREFIPTPSREKPFPDAKAVSGAQTIERLSRAIGSIEGQIRSQPVPENDRMTQRYRREDASLIRLIEYDQTLVGQAELLRLTVDQKNGGWLIENAAMIENGIAAIAATLRDRQSALLV
jgi:hypothetical protein